MSVAQIHQSLSPNSPSHLSPLGICSLHLHHCFCSANKVVNTIVHIHANILAIQSPSRVLLSATPWTAACQTCLSFALSQSLLKLVSIESMMPSNHLILCHSLLLLPSTFPSIRVFSVGSALLIRWTKYWSFSFSISPSNEYSWLISFQIDWFDLLAVQGAFKSLL